MNAMQNITVNTVLNYYIMSIILTFPEYAAARPMKASSKGTMGICGYAFIISLATW